MVLRRGSRGFLLPFAREKTIPASSQMRAGRYCMGEGACTLLHLHHTAEAHEGHRKDTCGDESNGDASHTLG